MKKVAIFTTTRAEFGILSPLLSALEENSGIIPLLFVGGSHLSKEHGNTIQEIKDRGYNAERMVEIIKNIKVDQNFMRKRLEFVE